MPNNLPAVLVVEDDPGIQHLIKALLKRLEVRTDIALNGASALELVRKSRYDLVVLDLMMPVMDGVTFANELVSIAPDLLNRTLVITALSEMHIEKTFGRKLPQLRLPILRKPFDISEFLRIVQRHLRIGTAVTDELIDFNARFRDEAAQIGAKAGILVVANPDGASLDLVCSYGYAPGTAESYFPMLIEKPFPICESFRSGKPVWIATLASAFAQYPQLAPIWLEQDSHGLAAIPVENDHVIVGAVGWSFAQPQEFDEEQQQKMLALADGYAQRITRLAEEPRNLQKLA